jgi:hypothetical protein
MKLFKMDLGWSGGFAVVAETREKAVELILERCRLCDSVLEEHEIRENLVVEFVGE